MLEKRTTYDFCFRRFDTMPACDEQTDRNVTANTPLSIATIGGSVKIVT